MIIPGIALDLSRDIIHAAAKDDIHIACAESCTGGLLAASLTNTPGASDVFAGGVVSYTNEVKMNALGVNQESLKSYSAVSEEVALEMAKGAHETLLAGFENSKVIAISTTGLAGPDGGTDENSIGTVWFGIFAFGELWSEKLLFHGEREAIRSQALTFALRLIKGLLET